VEHRSIGSISAEGVVQTFCRSLELSLLPEREELTAIRTPALPAAANASMPRIWTPCRVGTRIFDQWLSFSRISQRCFGEKLVAPNMICPMGSGWLTFTLFVIAS
jgi:hypothetical protein